MHTKHQLLSASLLMNILSFGLVAAPAANPAKTAPGKPAAPVAAPMLGVRPQLSACPTTPKSPDVCVTVAASLGPELSGPVVVDTGTYQSGGTATGASGSACTLTMVGGGASTAAVSYVILNATNTIPAGANFAGMLNEGNGYTSTPTTATLSNGPSSLPSGEAPPPAATCSGTATVTTKIGDPLGLVGATGTVTTPINPVGVTYAYPTLSYSGVTIDVENSANGATLPCSNATATLTASKTSNETLALSNCTLYLIVPTNTVATITANIAFPANTIPAPIPMAFSGSLIGSPTSTVTYTCTNPTFCAGQVGTEVTLGIGAGSPISGACQDCPTGSALPGTLTFNATAGGSEPTAQTVTVGSAPDNIPYAVVASQPWIVINGGGALGGNTGSGGTAGSVSVTVNPATLSPGPYSGTVTVYDATSNSPQTVTVNLTVASSSPPTITPKSLPNGFTFTAYPTQTLSATGGTPPYSSWTVSSGSFPPGLSLSASAGTISGTPTSTGTFNFNVTVKDSTGTVSAPVGFTINVYAPLSITTGSPLPNGSTGTFYTDTLAATGGTGSYTWSLTGGSLPTNLTLSSAGVISGTPSAATTATFTVMVTDAASDTASKTFSLTISSGVVITTGSLPNGEVTAPYAQTLAATGGTGTYTWSVTAGALPPGLTLSSTAGTITGSPTTTSGSPFAFTITATDTASNSGFKAFSIGVIAGPGITTTSPLPAGEVGASYSQTFAASNGTAPYSWSVTGGTLPPGLSLASTGALTGLPTTAGLYTFTVTVKDSVNGSASGSFNVTINSGPTITTSSLPSGEVGVSYNDTLSASGGSGTGYTWSATGLPSNLTLSTAGVISGSPSTSTGSPFTVNLTVKDSLGGTGTVSLPLTVLPGVSITTTSLPNGTMGTAYSATLVANGGTTPYTWSVSSGALPAGLTLNASTGAITGTPSTATSGPLSVGFTVKDNVGSTASATLSITIVAPLSVQTTTLPNGVLSTAYSASLSAIGGVPPYTWTLATGALPNGLTLSSSGSITGNPSAAGTFTFTAMVKDSASNTATSGSLSITISSGLTITTTSLVNGTVGTAYSQTLGAAGGTPPYTWSISSGTLPTGLTLNASTGAITGTPSAAGAFPFTAKVTDSASNTATQALSITIVTPPLTITAMTLPNGTVSVVYPTQTLAATGGVPPYSNWKVVSGALPTGLTLSASAGTISGTPSASGAYSFSVTVQDSTSTTSPAQPFSITVIGALTITTTSLPGGTSGVAYAQTLGAAGGTPPYTWSISSGTLPPGLSLNATLGSITGTPSTAGTYPFTVKVTDSASNTATQAFSITISASLTITTTTLPGGSVGVAYSQTLGAAGGTPPYTWSVSSGSLPPGISLNPSSGVVGGVPGTAGSYSFTVKVTDSASATATQPLTIVIAAALSVTTTSLPGGSLGVVYSQTLGAAGGAPPYTWSISGGSLPPGISLNPSTGVVGGTPSTAGTYPFTVMVKDTASSTATANLSISIVAGLTITTTSLPGGSVGVAYSQTLGGAGGTPPYTWSISAGSLPAGLTLIASSGTISGTPTTAGASSFTVTLKDSASGTATASLSITIITPLSITTSALAGGSPGVPYSTTLAATGGTPPYSNWIISSGALPPGLTLSASTGVISGTPSTATGSPFAFTVQVSDSASNTATKAFTLTISTGHLIVTPSPINFALSSTSAPTSTTFTVTASDGSAQAFTIAEGASNTSWLKLSATSGTTPATITATANAAGVVPGYYTIVLTFNAPGLGTPTATDYVELTVSGSNLSASPSMLTFTFQPGGAIPAAQTIALSTVNGTTVALGSVTTDVQWLQVTSAVSAPATLTVTVSPGSLAAGTYSGDVVVKAVGSSVTAFDIPVILTVNAEPALTLAPTTMAFSYQIGGSAPAAQTFTVSTGAATLTYSAASPGNWLQLSPSHGTTPGAVTVTAVPTGLAAGTYTGTINVSAIGASNGATVVVTLTITGQSVLTITPSTLAFTAPVGGPAPAPQTLMLGSSGGAIGFTAAAGSAWLSVSPASGTTPASLAVSVNPAGLTAGTYTGTVNLTAAGSSVPQMVIVTLTVGTVTEPTILGVINAASGAVGKVAPGMAISIFGTDLGPSTGVSFAAPPTGGTVATTLGGTQVLFDGTPVPVLFAWANQVNALVPFELASKVGGPNANTVLQVVYGGQTSAGDSLPVVATLPGLFAANGAGSGEGSILNQDSSINSTSNPAAAPSIIQLFGTGGGVTNPASIDGALNPLTSTGELVAAVTVTIGGQNAPVSYAGPAPGLVGGIFQVNAMIPSGTASGPQPVVVMVGGVVSQTGLTVAVQ
ncbi:MAG: putative Ig domain-containing protein [Bryobacteraceae bacterium]